MTNGNAIPQAPAEMTGLSDPGRRRSTNEDAFALLAQAGVALLADGMGGRARGELASTLALSSAVRSLLDLAAEPNDGVMPPAERLAAAFAFANRSVIERAVGESGAEGMGTTLTGVLFAAGRVHVAHVGDSRIYLLRAGELTRLTHDQTLGEMLATHGAASRDPRSAAPFSNVLTQAIGCDPEVSPEQFDLACDAGDLYLLCSDGLHRMLDDREIRLTLQKFGANLAATARELVRLANERGGLDNITVVLARPGIPG